MDFNNLTVHYELFSSVVFISINFIEWDELTGTVPKKFGNSVLIPIIKCINKFIDDVTNHLPICINPIIAKVFEACVSTPINDLLVFHPNQLGFVKRGGCSIIFALNTCIKYFRETE